VQRAEVLEDGAITEQVVNRDKEGVSAGDGCSLVAATGCNSTMTSGEEGLRAITKSSQG
jgi:hypothetical protein